MVPLRAMLYSPYWDFLVEWWFFVFYKKISSFSPPLGELESPVAHQLHAGLEDVDVESYCLIQGIESFTCGLPFVAMIAHELAHHRPILLFHMRLVILLVGTTPRKGDLLLPTGVEQVQVDELGAIVGISSQQRKGQTFTSL